MAKYWIVSGAILGFFGVAIGAFAGHVLKAQLAEKWFAIFQTAIQYHLWHALALIGVGLWGLHYPQISTQLPGWSFLAGTLLFSGSLYILSLTQISILGAITPFGGVLFLIGWFSFAWLAYRA